MSRNAAMYLDRGECQAGCGRDLVPGHKSCEVHLAYLRNRINGKRELARAEGKCTACFKAIPPPGRHHCLACRKRTRQTQIKHYCACGWFLRACYRRKNLPCLRCQRAEGTAPTLTERRIRDRARRAKREAEGLCTRCGKKPRIETAKYCEWCQEGIVAISAVRAERLKEQKRCVHCGRKPKSGRLHCEKCTKLRSASQAKWRANLRARGLCARCGEPGRPGKWFCSACAEVDWLKEKIRYEIRRGIA